MILILYNKEPPQKIPLFFFFSWYVGLRGVRAWGLGRVYLDPKRM